MTQEIINSNYSYSDICRLLNYPINSTGIRKAKRVCESFDTTHFGKRPQQLKYKWIKKECPVCSSVFRTQKDHPKEKRTCSYSCSNTFFRSGTSNPNWVNGASSYRNIALEHYGPRCNQCLWDKEVKILQVHHKDRDRSNNCLENLEILCPTCHDYEHYLSSDGRFSSRNL